MSKNQISTVRFGPPNPDDGNSYTAEFGITPNCEFGPWGWCVYVTYPDGLRDYQDNGFAGSAQEALAIVVSVHREALDMDRRHR